MLRLEMGGNVAVSPEVTLDREETVIGRSGAAHVNIRWDGASRVHAR